MNQHPRMIQDKNSGAWLPNERWEDFEDGGKEEREKWAKPSNELLEIGRKAIEDVLVEWRDGRLSTFNRGNGLVIREKDGNDSSIIRFGPETALKIGMKAIGEALKEGK